MPGYESMKRVLMIMCSRRKGDKHRTINCNGLYELRRLKKQSHMADEGH